MTLKAPRPNRGHTLHPPKRRAPYKRNWLTPADIRDVLGYTEEDREAEETLNYLLKRELAEGRK